MLVERLSPEMQIDK
jgi:hypothetical protein